LVSQPGRLPVGRAGYSLLCTPDGGVIDDLIVYRIADEVFLVVPNASNREVVAHELAARLSGHAASLEDETMATSLLAVQGPAAAAILARLTDLDLGRLANYAAAESRVAGILALVARTGYTGEDGFELFVAWQDAPELWQALLTAGGPDGLVACGLGARDTLRLEAGMPLYGNELGRDTTPFEAGLGWVVALDHPFVGRDALAKAAQGPLRKQLVGLILRGRGIARHGYPVTRPGAPGAIGSVTSGSQSPTLAAAVAMAYVPPPDAAPGTMLDIIVRDVAVPAEVVPLPFYRRAGRSAPPAGLPGEPGRG
jgi:aminomethyltransferase